MYNREQLDEIKRLAGITPYQKWLPDLKHIGSEYRALCPWHERDGGKHSPSLAVFLDKSGESYTFKCMGNSTVCAKRAGDVFAFVQFVDNCTFGEAVQKVAADAGLSQEQSAPKGIETPNAQQFDQVRQYLISQGIPLQFAKDYTGGKIDAVVHPKLGLALAFPYDADEQVIKYRAIKPINKDLKFAHASGHPSEGLLYNIQHVEKEIERDFCSEVYVVESERDCLTMEAAGFTTVSVSSATTCLDHDGRLKISDDQLKILAKADHVFVATDQDPAGEKCAEAFERSEVFNTVQVKRICWTYGGKRSSDPKDIGDLYAQDPAGFRDRIVALSDEARRRPPKWRQQFKAMGELDDREVVQLIEGFLTEGNVGLGGLSGHGKTFVALSIVKAVTTGKPFVGHFKVPEIHPVLYLCPEVGERQLRKRMKHFHITEDENLFLCRTLSQGPTLPLDDAYVLEAVRQLGHPVVVLDTAIRFSKAADENSASANAWLELAVRGLREAGAIAVILLHHSPKYASKMEDFVPTLENSFRGTGDIGALLDIAYNIRKDIKAPGEQITVTCVKPRDFDPPHPFNLGLKMSEVDPKTGHLRSFIEEIGDLVRIIRADVDAEPQKGKPRKGGKRDLDAEFAVAVQTDPKTSYGEVAEILGVTKAQVQKIAIRLGWSRPDGVWVKNTPPQTLPLGLHGGDGAPSAEN